jgi:CubicO group peptidase (beta-lactamase class C family)
MKTQFITTLLILAISITSCTDDIVQSPELEIGVTGDNLLLPNTQKILDDYNLPAIAGMSMQFGDVLEKIELGKQNYNESNEIIDDSKWHIGSITKSMTATLTGILVEAGHLSWNTKIGDLTTEGYLPEYQEITIYQLLSQTGGVTTEDYPIDPADSRPVSELRQEWAIAALNVPQGTVGQFAYGNSNYVIVGVMLEMIMEDSWENLITEYLFEPLEMNNTGFGTPGNNGETNQPWGHRYTGSSWLPKDPTDIYSDNPVALGPGGIVHTTMLDMAKYANLHLGKTNLIESSTLELLHTEVNNSGYALGWNVTENGISHAGSNTNWFAQLFINLDEEFVNFVVTNSYDLDGNISIPAVQNMMSIIGNRFANSK